MKEVSDLSDMSTVDSKRRIIFGCSEAFGSDIPLESDIYYRAHERVSRRHCLMNLFESISRSSP